MEELENQPLPLEPEHMEPPVQAETPAAPVEPAQEQVMEAPAPEIPPEPQHVPEPKRRSPYENAPYMMPHQPAGQTPPVQPAPVQRQKRSKGGVLRTVVSLALLAALIASMVLGGIRQARLTLQIQDLQDQLDVLRQEAAPQHQVSGESVSGTPNATADGSLTPAQVYAQNLHSVVLIETDVATGSGFVLTQDGYVVTNYHVIEDGEIIDVVLYDNTVHAAELVGYEANIDLALLKIEGNDFEAVTLGSSDDLIVGDQVAAIGNPLGELTSTLTVGFVSAKERDVATDSTTISMLQTDCAINSGNSGGPLFNMRGEVVGITTAKYSGMSTSGASIEGIGFAVPVDDVTGILDDLMEFGYVKSGYLGVTIYNMDPAEAAMFNLPLGCLVDSVTPGSCADRAGVQASDIIIGLGGHVIDGYTDLSRVLRDFDGGESTTITVYRNGRELILPIVLDAKPHETQSAPDDSNMPADGSYEEWYNYFFGE